MRRHKKQASELRHDKRLLLRRGVTRDKITTYADNVGHEYNYLWIARVSSFCNVIGGCFRNGFPIVVSHLWYNAWAFYPFFCVRKKLTCSDPIPTLNHERIHVRQQRDLHLLVSLPLLILAIFAEICKWFNPLWIFLVIPFVPTIFYGIELLRVALTLRKTYEGKITFNTLRENTCYERESIMRATNADYLLHRKFLAVLAFKGWKIFQNYGID